MPHGPAPTRDPLPGPSDPPPGGWVAWRGSRSLLRTFRRDWARVDPASRRAWATTLLAGWLACGGLSAVSALIGRAFAAGGWADWDRELLLRIAQDERFSFQTAIWFEGWGSSAMLIPVVVLATILAARAHRPLLALTIPVGYLAHDPLVWVGWTVWDRARPDLVAGGIASPPLHSFPSGHAVQTLAVYGLLAWLWARGSESRVERVVAALSVLAAAGLVSYARLRLGTHWPTDIVAGVLLGASWLAVLILALRRGEPGRAPRAPSIGSTC